ncbi:hypothetical protein J7K44_02225, partial [bacterium]|nr:hypothetical protein [bacterium]
SVYPKKKFKKEFKKLEKASGLERALIFGPRFSIFSLKKKFGRRLFLGKKEQNEVCNVRHYTFFTKTKPITYFSHGFFM